MTDYPGYVQRQKARVAVLRLKQQIVFGYGIGAFLIFLGGFFFWRFTMWLGAAVLLVTLTFPSAWSLPERGFRRVTGKIGHTLFLIILAIVYYLMIYPVGVWLGRRYGKSPIWEWTESPASGAGWQEKTCTTIVPHPTSTSRQFLLFQPFRVIGFFIQYKTYLFLPVIIVLITLGLILFFVQTSVLSPFIYTLF